MEGYGETAFSDWQMHSLSELTWWVGSILLLRVQDQSVQRVVGRLGHVDH